jgi:homoserine O-acetyltransferase
VETQRAVLFADAPLVLEGGGELAPVEVAYETYGTLDAAGANAVVVLHALTGDAHAAGHHGDPARRGWWDALVGPERPVDTDRHFVVCANLLGGCQGTTGPSSVDPATGRPYGFAFPLLTVRDLVAVHRALLAHLGVERVHAAIGGSLGGMQALQWALDHPEELDRAVLVGASARLTAQNLAFSAVGRAAIRRDPALAAGAPVGLAVARMLAHITYLSEPGMSRKFDRARRGEGMTLDPDFEVEHYLDHQGEAFLARFDALSYLYLSRAMDYFEPFAAPPGPGPLPRCLVISFDTDWRFGSAHSRHIAAELAARGADVRHAEVSSPWGHDSFLLELPGYHALVEAFLREERALERAGPAPAEDGGRPCPA